MVVKALACRVGLTVPVSLTGCTTRKPPMRWQEYSGHQVLKIGGKPNQSGLEDL